MFVMDHYILFGNNIVKNNRTSHPFDPRLNKLLTCKVETKKFPSSGYVALLVQSYEI